MLLEVTRRMPGFYISALRKFVGIEQEFARRMQFLIAGNGVVDTRGRLHANFLICLDVVGVFGQDVSVHRQNTFYGAAEAVCNLLQVVPGHHAI